MIKNNIETMRAGKVLPDHCQCGHLKDRHLPMIQMILGNSNGLDAEEFLQCQDYVFDTKANNMLQCKCRI